ncbi:MAG: DUF423 domain-containing protein [Bacteroidota bacterium]|nr:DUF423 domain-containing protein [Bacteroidota bacterium]
MKKIVLQIGGAYAVLSVVLGAFGAHAFKAVLASDKLASFEVGVRYQMYAALLLLIVGFGLDFSRKIERLAGRLVIVGAFLFSVSIYFLAFQDVWGVKLSFFGPITPLGGMLFIVGLVLFTISFSRKIDCNDKFRSK